MLFSFQMYQVLENRAKEDVGVEARANTAVTSGQGVALLNIYFMVKTSTVPHGMQTNKRLKNLWR